LSSVINTLFIRAAVNASGDALLFPLDAHFLLAINQSSPFHHIHENTKVWTGLEVGVVFYKYVITCPALAIIVCTRFLSELVISSFSEIRFS